MPTLHVVIPFYNEGGTIETCVQRVLAAALPEGWSRALVFVDDHSGPGDQRTLEALVERCRA
ncbi:MAG: glycosyltransferase, partial [Planctomycetota bacterium]